MNKFFSYKTIIFSIILLAFFLRIYQMSTQPQDLYIDEVSIGWNAWSVLQTSHGEHNGWMPVWFESFGEYKLPVYIYMVALSMILFGKNAFAVRIPSVVCGTATILFFMLLITELSQSKKLALFSGLLLAISPWHLQFSRVGYEATGALFFITVGVYFLIKGLRNHSQLFFLGFFCLILSPYTYHFARIISPILLFGIFFWYRKKLPTIFKKPSGIGISLILLLLTIPLLSFNLSAKGRARAAEVFFMNDFNSQQQESKTIWALSRLGQNYASFFSIDFLFFSGDQQGRHSVREMGMNYLWQLPFLLFGIYGAYKTKNAADRFFFFWLLISPLAAIFAAPNPHAVRGLPEIIPLMYFVSRGIISTHQYVTYFRHPGVATTTIGSLAKKKLSSSNFQTSKILKRFYRGALRLPLQNDKVFIILFFPIIAFSLALYLHIYYVHYPKRASLDWFSGYKEAMEYAYQHRNEYEQINLTKSFLKGYVFLYFYNDVDPKIIQNNPERENQFENIEFVNSPYYFTENKKTLYIGHYKDEENGHLIKTIYNRGNDPMFSIWEN